MLLTYHQLRELVVSGAVSNIDLAQVNGSSVDVTLADRFMVEHGYGTEQKTDRRAHV